jgi:transposase InsO family protein
MSGRISAPCASHSFDPENRSRTPTSESFNGRFRDECLNEHWFLSMQHARSVIEAGRIEYNTERPHSSLDDLTPEEFRHAHASAKFTGSVSVKPKNPYL